MNASTSKTSNRTRLNLQLFFDTLREGSLVVLLMGFALSAVVIASLFLELISIPRTSPDVTGGFSGSIEETDDEHQPWASADVVQFVDDGFW